MATPAEILITGGVVAILAAAIGGGLKAFGFELPLVSTVKRQALLFVIGIAFLGSGFFVGRPPSDPPVPIAKVSGADVIDFRPSLESDPSNERLLVTTNIAFETLPTAHGPVRWTGTTAYLKIGGAKVPFRSYYFTNLTNDVRQWYGENPISTNALIVMPNQIVSHDVMFAPEDTGTGPYQWAKFKNEVFGNGQTSLRFSLEFEWSADGKPMPPLTLECTTYLGNLVPSIRKDMPKLDSPFRMSADCEKK